MASRLSALFSQVFEVVSIDQDDYRRVTGQFPDACEEAVLNRVKWFTSRDLFQTSAAPILVVLHHDNSAAVNTSNLYYSLRCLTCHVKVYLVVACAEGQQMLYWGETLLGWRLPNLTPVQTSSYHRDLCLADAFQLAGLLLVSETDRPKPLELMPYPSPTVPSVPKPRPAWKPFLICLAAFSFLGIVHVKIQ